ncbi:ParA family protein (plasmid) [Haloterrigena salifodinae]|uniref:ParA family protein n=1 Tax=Haloterrigena salifodinae TaxID=2675099 RepID=A0A8T8E7Y0_9EURY|nr:ParA family protein [Haloterrigena salifodinae]QRV17471.1 ParA family protein [Haloterrigena salifodinae]
MSDDILSAAFYVPKGGIAKTTSAAHIGVSGYQNHGHETVLIDLAGTQNDLATQFGLQDDVADPDIPISIVFSDKWDLLRDNADDIVDRMVYETDEGVDLIPADDGLSAEDNNLANVPLEDRYDRLESFIAEEIAPRYDLVLFDLPGKEDNITINGLHAAENVIAPLKPGAFELAQLENLEDELATIANDDDHDADPTLQLVFATMVDRTTNLSSEFADQLEADYPEISGSPVAESANISDGQSAGRTLFAFEDDELYNTGKRARKAYRELTDELLSRLKEN